MKRFHVLAALLSTLSGCNAVLGDGGRGSAEANAEGGETTFDEIPWDEGAIDGPRLQRLTHAEWEATVGDLLGLKSGGAASEAFRGDPIGGYLFDNHAESLDIDSALWHSYSGAAEEIAAQLLDDADALNALAPDTGGTNEERAREFVESFGLRAHRRPLTEQQISGYMEVYQVGEVLQDGAVSFEAGIGRVVEAFLLSPHFLFKVESLHGTSTDNQGQARDGYERAARLSYFLWGTMPDAELFEAARVGRLDTKEGVGEQVDRMLLSGRLADTVALFVSRVFDIGKYSGISPASSVYDGDLAGLQAAAVAEVDWMARHVLLEGSLGDLFTSTRGYVNAQSAEVYGMTGSFSDAFTEARLDETTHSGILTRIGFNASNATSVHPDPIHRGAFVGDRIACSSLPPPPDDIPALPDPAGRTVRENVDNHTSAGACVGCHAIINGFGHPFGHYDAVGRYQLEDSGFPVDASAELVFPSGTFFVEGAIELSSVFSSSPEVHSCLAGHLFSKAMSRNVTDEDKALVEGLGAHSAEGHSFRSLLRAIVLTDSFLNVQN